MCTAVTTLTGKCVLLTPVVGYSYSSAEGTEFMHELFKLCGFYAIGEKKKRALQYLAFLLKRCSSKKAEEY